MKDPLQAVYIDDYVAEFPEPFGGRSGWGVDSITALTLSPDGRFLAALTETSSQAGGVFLVWDVSNGRYLGAYFGWSRLFFSQDGSHFAAIAGKDISVGSTRLMQTVATLRSVASPAPDIILNEVWLVQLTEAGELQVFDWASAQSVGSRPWAAPIRRFQFALDGRALVVGDARGELMLWRVGEEEPSKLGEHPALVDLDVSPDGRSLASVSEDGLVQIWDLALQEARLSFFVDPGVVGVLWADEPDTVLTVTDAISVRPLPRATVEIDSLGRVGSDNLRQLSVLAILGNGVAEVVSVAVSPDGRQVAAGLSDGTVARYDLASGEPTASLQGHSDVVRDLAFSPDGAWLASVADDGRLLIWDVGVFGVVHQLEAHPGGALSVAFDASRPVLASAGVGGKVRLWDPNVGELVGELDAGKSAVLSLSIDPWGRFLVSGSLDGTVVWWDLEASRKEKEFLLRQPDESVTVLSSDPRRSNLFLAGTHLGHVALIYLHAEPAHVKDPHPDYITGVFVVGSTGLVTTSLDGTLRIQDIRCVELEWALCDSKEIQFSDVLWDMAASGDGRLLAAGTDRGFVYLLGVRQ